MLRSSFLWDPPALTFRVGRRGSGCRQRVRGWVTVLQDCPNEARRGEAWVAAQVNCFGESG